MSKLDFHGSELTAQHAKCPSAVGLSGIVVQETRYVFRLVTKKNEMKTLLKDGSVFVFQLGPVVISVIGSSILSRPADRAAKKIKITQPVFKFALSKN
jgi:ribonuclease P protein subunit POP4